MSLVFSLGLLGAVGCTVESSDPVVVVPDNVNQSTLTVSNRSDFALTEVYIVSVGSPDWGLNQIEGDVLLPGEDVLLTGIPCDTHDVMMVAEDGASCELHDIDLCFDDRTWIIRNDTCDELHKPTN